MSKYALLWVCITVAISGLYWVFCVLVFINMNNDTYTQIKKQQEAQQEKMASLEEKMKNQTEQIANMQVKSQPPKSIEKANEENERSV